jgi:hypothetical protein
MFYCTPCGTERGWPETGFKSHGKCECCGASRPCNDLPSKYLPYPKTKKST